MTVDWLGAILYIHDKDEHSPTMLLNFLDLHYAELRQTSSYPQHTYDTMAEVLYCTAGAVFIGGYISGQIQRHSQPAFIIVVISRDLTVKVERWRK